ncbi:MAG: hypothetical protein JWO19_4821 [Bryobacterales bacterium]|nr:hypothetical protein [Bryobacterales bacterium]
MAQRCSDPPKLQLRVNDLLVTRREWIALTAAAGLRAQSADDSVGAARDLVYQALELLSPHAAPAEITRALRFLRGALDQYPGFGDAHYYRSLCLQHLKQDPTLQKSDLEAAQRYQSEALRDKRDPFFLAVPKIDENLARVGQKWALVIGISRFQPEKGPEPLTFAANDAKALADLLRDPSAGRFPANQVFELINQAATTSAIKARLNTIATRAKPEDIVLVYVSTHGSSRADDIRQVSYLYTYDTDVTSRDQIFGTALAMVDLSGIISNRCLAQRTVVIFDTCHSGAGVAAQALTPVEIDRLREGAGRYILSSCEPNQRSYESAGHGFFTASLIDHLRARKGCVSVNDLFKQVRTDVIEKVRKLNKEQRPVIANSERAAEIVLGAAVGSPSGGCGTV